MNLNEWADFYRMVKLLEDFTRLDPEDKEKILLMIDGYRYRKQNKENSYGT